MTGVFFCYPVICSAVELEIFLKKGNDFLGNEGLKPVQMAFDESLNPMYNVFQQEASSSSRWK